MRFISRLHSGAKYESVVWHSSKAWPNVRYAIRRISLGQRIDLTRRARELAQRNEFLRAGEAVDQLEAALSDLLVRRMYLEWGLISIDGLTVDDEPASVSAVADKGPETLTDEIIESLRGELGLTEEETKNS
jgi:hypothetical protein